MLGRPIRNLVPAPGSLDELRRALQEQLVGIPLENINRIIIENMPRSINAVILARAVILGINTSFPQME